jgi:hypothetical protein
MPVGDVLVCDAGCHVEHDDTALSVDVVSIAETAELLLTSCVPNIELDLAEVLPLISILFPARRIGKTYGGEAERVDLDTERRDVLLLKLARKMALDEGGLECYC